MSDSKKKISDELMARYLDGLTNEAETCLVENYLASDEDALNEAIAASREIAFQQIKKQKSVYAKSIISKENMSDDIRYQIAGHGKQSMAAKSNEQKCAIKAQQLVLENYGIKKSTEELTEIARENGWFIDEMGSPLDFVGELLNYYEVPAVQMRNANMYHIMNELSQGHKIIVGLDENELEQSAEWNDFNDKLVGKEANHVLVVAGIDTTNPKDVKVVVADPTKPEAKKTYPAKQFLEAWEDSGYFMVATNTPAPMALNPEMQNFDYQKGYVQKFADLAYAEIIKRLADDGFIDGDSKKMKNLALCLAIILAFAGITFLAWRFFTPINIKISVTENSSFKIPSLPFESGKLTCEYADNMPQTFTLSNEIRTILLDDISYRYKNKKVHVVFEASGYQTIDTMMDIQRTASLSIKRNNDLGLIFGSIIDGKTGLPVAGAEITVQDIKTESDASGKFKIEIPFAKQAKAQRMQIFKEGYPLWTGTYRPSQTNAWEIVF